MTSEDTQQANSIVAKHVSRMANGRMLLKDISLRVFQGEIFGILGRSGGGKTTLLRILAGLDKPNSGSVVIQAFEDDNSDWVDTIPAVALQSPGVAPELTVNENMRLFARLWGLPRRGRSAKIAKYLEMLELSDLRMRRVRDLPHSAKIRLELARTLVSESNIVMIDCLLETLPQHIHINVWRHLQSRAKNGAAIIIATVSSQEAELCERISLIKNGRIEFIGAPEELIRSVGPNTIVVKAVRPPLVMEKIKEKLCVAVEQRDGALVFTTSNGCAAVSEIISELGSDISAVYLQQPNLADALEKLQ